MSTIGTTPENRVVFAPTLEVPGDLPIHLRLADERDGVEIFDIVEANREFLYPQWWTRNIKTLEDVEEHTRHGLQRQEENASLQYRIVEGLAEEGARGPIVGTVTVYQHDPLEHSARFGYWVTEAVAQRGYGYRATGRTLEYAKEALGIQTVKAQIDIANRRSERLAVKLGCVVAGTPEPLYAPTGNGDETELRIIRMWGKKL